MRRLTGVVVLRPEGCREHTEAGRTVATYHFDLSWTGDPPATPYTFHRAGRAYPIEQHTEATIAAARAGEGMLAGVADEQLTHFVADVDTGDAGVTIHAVRTPMEVPGPAGTTQEYRRLVTYTMSVPGDNRIHAGLPDLAYALLFAHNNLLRLDDTDDFEIPRFVLEECIVPSAGDLVQALKSLPLVGKKWISDPYPVTGYDEDGSESHLVGEGGEWVYTQSLNDDALQPALGAALGEALRRSKTAKLLEGSTWSVQQAVLSSDYQASSPDEQPAAGAGADKWTLAGLSPRHGLSVDPASLRVDRTADADKPGYGGRIEVTCHNTWLRHLGAYVEFLKWQGEGSGRKLVPINLGASDTIINPEVDPEHPIYNNVTWPGDWSNHFIPGGLGSPLYPFMEPSHTVKFLAPVSPVGTICGIPVPEKPTKLTIRYIPDDANVVRLSWGGLGRGAYDVERCALGVTLTAVCEIALPTIFFLYGATHQGEKIIKEFWTQPKLLLQAAQTLVTVIMDLAKLSGATALEQSALEIGKFLAEKLLPTLLKTPSIAAKLAAAIGEGAAEEAIPFVNIAMLIFNSAVTAAQLAQTIHEVLESPFVFTSDIARTFDAQLTIEPDPTQHHFPAEAIGGTYQVVGRFSDGATTTAVAEGKLPDVTASAPIELHLKDLPAGGTIQFLCSIYSKDGWLAGQGCTEVLPAHGNNGTTLYATLATQNLPPPLGEFSQYEFTEKTVLDGGERAWQGKPAAAPPAATRGTTELGALAGITICEDAGMLGYTFQDRDGTYIAQNVSLLADPQDGFARSAGNTVLPGLVYDRAGGGPNFLIDGSPATNPDGGCHLRRLDLVFDEGHHRSLPPEMDPDPGMSWGRFPVPIYRAALHGGYVAGISFDDRHSKVFVVKLPDAPSPVAVSPKATMFSGPGAREGLISLPRGLAFGLDGRLLVLDAGNRRVQAFDVHGSVARCFGTGDAKQATFPLEGSPTATYLDIAVEPKGYVYVLRYEGRGATAADYHLDLYRPDGTHLATTPDFAAAAICVDITRDLYTLNYESLAGAREPSVSLWIPPVKPDTRLATGPGRTVRLLTGCGPTRKERRA